MQVNFSHYELSLLFFLNVTVSEAKLCYFAHLALLFVQDYLT